MKPRIFKIKILDADLLKNYPCDTYLHNALGFIEVGKWENAYCEICHAILKSDGELSTDERMLFDTFSRKDV